MHLMTHEIPTGEIDDLISTADTQALTAMTLLAAQRIRANEAEAARRAADLALHRRKRNSTNTYEAQLIQAVAETHKRMRLLGRLPGVTRRLFAGTVSVKRQDSMLVTDFIPNGIVLENHVDPTWGSHTLTSGIVASLEPTVWNWQFIDRLDPFHPESASDPSDLVIRSVVTDMDTNAQQADGVYRISRICVGMAKRVLIIGGSFDEKNNRQVLRSLLDSYPDNKALLGKRQINNRGLQEMEVLQRGRATPQPPYEDEQYLKPLILVSNINQLLGIKNAEK